VNPPLTQKGDLENSILTRFHNANLPGTIENYLLAAMFSLAIALPLIEMILRAAFHVGIVGVTSIVQHLMLAVGMLGAAIAAREERLLTLAFSQFIKGRVGVAAKLFNRMVAATVTAILFITAVVFTAAEYRSGMTWLYGIPVWVVELPLSIGFCLIALRLIGQTAASVQGKVATGLISLAWAVGIEQFNLYPSNSTAPILVLLIAATLLGAPIFIAIGGAAFFLLVSNGVPAAAVAVDHYSLVMNSSLPAIPMFTLAGFLLAQSSSPRRLVNLFNALFGRVPGGPAMVTVLACTFFTSFTGASGVTVLALGGLVMPLLLSTGYSLRPALGLVTSAGLPGTLLMPALPLILYAIVADVAIHDMFIGGVLPTLLMAGLISIWGVFQQHSGQKTPVRGEKPQVWQSLWEAKWELSVPTIPMIALLSGRATPMESAALTACYVLFITVVVRHDLALFKNVPAVITECGLIVGGILLIMGVALGLTDYFVDAQVPDRIVEWVTHIVRNKYLFLFALNLSLLAAGCLIEIYPAIMVLAPIVTHVGKAFDINPVHLGMIFLSNMELGYLTPLVGLNLFFAAYRFNKPVMEVFKAILPLFIVLALGVFMITYVPWLSTGLLTLFK
jgi:C4-dicarboxylate transporter DctM subunit